MSDELLAFHTVLTGEEHTDADTESRVVEQHRTAGDAISMLEANQARII